jgi:hypothetical protein
MAAKNLTTAEMIGVTRQWTTSDEVRPLLDVLDAPGIVRAVERSHAALVDSTKATDASQHTKALDAIYEEATAQDRLHDRKGGGVAKLLEALAELTDDAAESERYSTLRTALFPTGDLAVLGASWRGESGNAARLHQQLEGERDLVAALKQIPAGEKSTLLARVKQFVGAGLRLGALEDDRVRVEGDVAAQKAGGATARPETAARNAWIRAVNALVSAVENSDDLTDEQRKVVVRVFRDAEARADKRALARRAGASPEEGGDGGDGSAKPTA